MPLAGSGPHLITGGRPHLFFVVALPLSRIERYSLLAQGLRCPTLSRIGPTSSLSFRLKPFLETLQIGEFDNLGLA